MASNGVKVTYIETQFVTSDAAGFKSLVQRLTGKSAEAGAEAAARPLHRPRPSRPAAEGRNAAAGARSHFMPATAGAAGTAGNDVRAANANAGAAQQTFPDELYGLCDYSELFCAGDRRHGGSYSDFLY
ncbi:hypothetical protein CFC21_018708 [Triticum aestivum]|uniref:VQ domain-containing protein n=3 Tax=Triticum TaxID=4564 RepID=A0A9R1P3U6_TRITD|nr:hypothetical protein CFC21_018708 [Triticum aestivum]VAH36054.1 unnamed protein product [Triticum turgidum subsp. durum]